MQSKNKYEFSGIYKVVKDIESKLDITTILQLYKNSSAFGEISIPANWELQGFNNYDGSLWYILELPPLERDSDLKILEFNGVDYFSDVWINESYVGSHEGYFQKFFFDISDVLNNSENNLLVVKVTSPREIPGDVWPDKKQLIKGIFNHHDCRPGGWSHEFGQDKNTGGIWNTVNLFTGLHCFIYDFRITPSINRDKKTANIKIEFSVEGKIPDEFNLKIISPGNAELNEVIILHDGDNTNKIYHELVIDNPLFWNPHELGNPDLYEIILSGEGSNSIRESFGIRELSLDENQTFFINGKRLFLRGTNIIPAQFLSELDKERIKTIIDLLLEANINIVRVHAHVNRKELYDALDKAGIMVWQDFALQWTYDESEEFRKNAIRQIGDMVTDLYNHPSIMFWCCHNEPGDQIKTLDVHLEKAIKSLDSSRIIRRASNYEEHPYDGWYWGNKEHFVATPMGPLVTEFGAQAIPLKETLLKFMTEEEIEKPDWDKWTYHNFQYDQTFNVAEIEQGENLQEFIDNSQAYQAELIKRAVNFYRRKRFKGITGIFQFMFIDCWSSITWSVVDYYLNHKKGFEQLKKVYEPLMLSCELRQRKYLPGNDLQIDMWIINDLHESFPNLNIRILIKGKVIYVKNSISIKPDSQLFINYQNIKALIPPEIEHGKNVVEFQLLQNNKIIISNLENIEVVKKITSWS